MIQLTNTLPHTFYYVLLAIFLVVLIYTIIRILLDTQSTSKTLAYILLVIVLPVVGILIYFSFGINYRQKKNNREGAEKHKEFTEEYKKIVPDQTEDLLRTHSNSLSKYTDLIKFVYSLGYEKLCINKYMLLLNGEEKFPEVLKSLKTAKHFIHMEYYDWENDIRGNQIKEVLITKVGEGVKVRVMYDAYASRKIVHNIVKELEAAGVEIHPVIKIKFVKFANRINHRDHRKVIVIDGLTGFVGGINISDRYDNSIDTGLYWRDTHVKIMGETVHSIQRHFIVNWNTCQPNKLSASKELFPDDTEKAESNDIDFAQIVAGGPIYSVSTVMLSYSKIFTSATKKLYITNPYFIPNETILDSLKQAAISGVDVRIMMPEKSDSAVVGAASKFYYAELLQAGVKIYLYKKGFAHAKTVVCDTDLSVVGTANMDIRSFDLNFEIFSIIYGKTFAQQLENAFMEDLKESDELTYKEWSKQGVIKKLTYAVARLISSFL
jgi:cardiolipin synthase